MEESGWDSFHPHLFYKQSHAHGSEVDLDRRGELRQQEYLDASLTLFFMARAARRQSFLICLSEKRTRADCHTFLVKKIN